MDQRDMLTLELDSPPTHLRRKIRHDGPFTCAPGLGSDEDLARSPEGPAVMIRYGAGDYSQLMSWEEWEQVRAEVLL